jgi:hypothetical protein
MLGVFGPGILLHSGEILKENYVDRVPDKYYTASKTAMARNNSKRMKVNEKLKLISGQLGSLVMEAKDYEMSSEVAHSSPLLIYSNKRYFKSLTIVRSYESFIRLEDLFFKYLQTFNDIERESYEKMRNVYLSYIKRILNREVQNFNS